MSFRMVVTPGNHSSLVKRILLARGNWQSIEPEQNLQNQILKANFVWSPNSLPLRFYSIIEQHIKQYPNKTILLNHFENHRVITTKVNLIRTLKNYYNKEEAIFTANYGVFVTTPTTFIITIGIEDKQSNDFYQRYYEIEKGSYNRERIPAKHCKQNLWLVKPANMNQGRGIQIFKNIKQISSFLASKPLNTVWVVQKYIEKPLLYNNRKFDIRVWVIVTNKCQVYFYRKGYIRTSSDIYSMENFNNYVHLTNNCLQKFGSGYSKYEDGNTLPLQILQQYINGLQKYKNVKFNLERDIITRIKDFIIDTIVAGKKAFNTKKKEFQLFGYDFLVDQDLRTWLIQVNTNPYLGIPNDYIKDLLNLMVDDMLKIVVDPLFPPKNKNIYSQTNNFQLIYSQDLNINIRSPFTKPIYPIQQLSPPPNKIRKVEQFQIEQRRVVKQSNIQQNLKMLIQTYVFNDYQPFHKPLSRILSTILNWQIQSQENRMYQGKLLRMLFQSRFNGIFVEQNYLENLVKIIDSQNFPAQIQIIVLQGLIILSKNIQKKKKIMSPVLIGGLVKIALSLFNQKQYKDFDKNLIKLSVKCLISLAGVCDFKYFIPGETRQNEIIRQLFMRYNGLCVLILVQKQQQFKEEVEQFLNKLDINDWQFQLSLLKQQNVSKIKMGNIRGKIQLKPEDIINIPGLQLHKTYLKEYVINKISEKKEQNIRRELQMKQRRQKFEQFQQKMRQQKQKMMLERKLKADQYMKKKNQQRLKLKLEQQKKIGQMRALQQQRKKRLAEQNQKRKLQMKVMRNQSNQKMQKQQRRQKSQRERKSKQKQKQRYTTEERNRILTEWLQGKKQQQKRKKQQIKQQEMRRMKMIQQRKYQIQRRVSKLKQKSKKRASNPQNRNEAKQQDIVDKIITNSKSKSIFPKVPKIQKATPRIMRVSDSLKDSEDQKQSANNKDLIKPSTSFRQQNEQHRAFRHFLNSIKKNSRQKKTKFQVKKTNRNAKNQIFLLQDEINRKLIGNTYFLNNKNQEQFYSNTSNENSKKQKGNQAQAVVDFLLSSPYSSFVRKHYKIKELLTQLEKE